jgi:hypothetical protein
MIKTVLDTCASHLSVSGEAEMHYRNVCRALISEALEFSSFLERTKQSDIFDKELSNLVIILRTLFYTRNSLSCSINDIQIINRK